MCRSFILILLILTPGGATVATDPAGSEPKVVHEWRFTEADLYLKAAEAGDVHAATWLALEYATGSEGLKQDVPEALRWIRGVQDRCEIKYLRDLGDQFREGDGVPADPAIAVELYKMGAQRGDSSCMYWLGYIYGIDGPLQDHRESIRWYEKAAELGHRNALGNLAAKYRLGLGVTKDPAKALELFHRSAELGSSWSMYWIAVMYYNGEGVAVDKSESAHWFRKSAEGGDKDAMYGYAAALFNGEGVVVDIPLAMVWLHKAAEAGLPLSMRVLGDIYTQGAEGVPEDPAQGRQWYVKAAQAGDEQAKKWLEEHPEDPATAPAADRP